MHRVWTLALVTVLAACSSQDDPPDTAAQPSPQSGEAQDASEAAAAGATSIEELSGQEFEALARDPEALREMMQDPARRAALRERMRQLRQERAGDAQGPGREQAMRERTERHRSSPGESESGEARRRVRAAPWWEDEAIAQDLGLSEAQTTRISEAHAEMMEAARRSRRQLAQAVGDLQEALAANDREKVAELVDARVAALDARARAEAEWTRRLLDILDAGQRQQLGQEHPGLMSALLSPVR